MPFEEYNLTQGHRGDVEAVLSILYNQTNRDGPVLGLHLSEINSVAHLIMKITLIVFKRRNRHGFTVHY